MAQMPDLLEELSRLDGRPVETLHWIARTLRTAGHVQQGRRGVTSQLEARSAASMLLAVMSGVQPAETPRAVDVYSSLRPKRKGGFGKGFPSLEFVASADTFGQALEQLLLLAPRLKREAITLLTLMFDSGKLPVERLLNLELFSVELTIQRPTPYAKLTLEAVNEAGLYTHCFCQEWIADAGLFMAGFYRPEMRNSTDLRTQTSITHKTIFRLGDLLAAAPDDATEEVKELSHA